MMIIFMVVLVFSFLLLPLPETEVPCSTVMYDKNQILLGGIIADDGQWRFPPSDSIPEKYIKALLQFEDKRFYHHLGVDPMALARALFINIKNKKIISGGSTVTMQVIRLMRKRERTFMEKFYEILLSLRFELKYSKKEIIRFYTSLAPYGGNTVGIEAAAWRYFGRNFHSLSYAEISMLAVLPNSPGLIHLDKNRKKLLLKRNKLLKKLRDNHIIDSLSYNLSILEELPPKPRAIPLLAKHLLTRLDLTYSNEKIKIFQTSIDAEIQRKANEILNHHHKILKLNHINNMAALVIDVNKNSVVSYHGNVENAKKEFSNDVDIINSPRSTGSILKPFLFAVMINEGEILPTSLIPDYPTRMGNFNPRNFDLGYEGAIPAKRALTRSLNVPAVLMLQNFGVNKFFQVLKKCGMKYLHFPPEHYGLSLILGGAEASLWEVGSMYCSLTRIANGKNKDNNGNYFFSTPSISTNSQKQFSILTDDFKGFPDKSPVDQASSWLTINALLDVVRPEDEMYWRDFNSTQKIAWKTGTSVGFRDAWSVGTNGNYVVAVWVGNADGEGRPGLTGISAAAPVMFDIFNILPLGIWLEKPEQGLIKISVCSKSGYRTSEYCEKTDTVISHESGIKTPVCPFHQLIHLDKSLKWRVHGDCENISQIQHLKWFVLPPAMEHYFKPKHIDYKTLPHFRKNCIESMGINKTPSMELIYPKPGIKIYIPIEIHGKPGKVIFEATHRIRESLIFWHLDENYLATTKDFHQLALQPSVGKHKIILIDENGERVEEEFEILGK